MQTPDARPALAELLSALGFRSMAREVRKEEDPSRIRVYARIIYRNAPESKRRNLRELFGCLSISVEA